MSCLVEDFRFCLLIGVGGFWFLKGEGEKKRGSEKGREGGKISPQNCRVALNPNWVLMAATPGEHGAGH